MHPASCSFSVFNCDLCLRASLGPVVLVNYFSSWFVKALHHLPSCCAKQLDETYSRKPDAGILRWPRGREQLAVSSRSQYGTSTEGEPKLNKHGNEGWEGVQGCARRGGGYGERFSGRWSFDAVMWNGWGNGGLQSPSLSGVHPSVTPRSFLRQTLSVAHHQRLCLFAHVCHPSRYHNRCF